jgi:hypothetical protein
MGWEDIVFILGCEEGVAVDSGGGMVLVTVSIGVEVSLSFKGDRFSTGAE